MTAQTLRDAQGEAVAVASPRRRALLAAVLLAVLLVLGALARTRLLTRGDLRADQQARGLRSPAATAFFEGLTAASAEAVGLGALVVAVVVLIARRRRFDAARLLLTAGAAWALALVLKAVVDRPRPPASLWVQTPDQSGSFPSGHDTTATLLIVIVLVTLAGAGTARLLAAALAVAFALAVGVGRVYLGDHYPTDVVGSYLTVAVAALTVRAVTDLPRVRALAARLLRTPLDVATPPDGPVIGAGRHPGGRPPQAGGVDVG